MLLMMAAIEIQGIEKIPAEGRRQDRRGKEGEGERERDRKGKE